MNKEDLIKKLEEKIDKLNQAKYKLSPIDFEQHTLINDHKEDFLWVIVSLKNLKC